LKRIYRILSRKLSIFIFSNFSKLLSFFNFKIIPSISELDHNNYKYSKYTRRIVFNSPKNLFSKLIIDTSNYNSNLCNSGANYKTNKSPLNIYGHRSGYTPYYDLLFRHLKDEKINFAEIGIEKNASTKMWRKYFSKAMIYGFEYDDIKIRKAKKHKLKNTFYKKVDVTNQQNIKHVFSKLNKNFEIIIDDSTHIFDHQMNIIRNVYPYLKKKGILVIEDINKYRQE